MSFDEEVRDQAMKAARSLNTGRSGRPNQSVRAVAVAGVTLDAISPLTLKTEDGHFVRVEESCGEPGEGWYRIVEAPE